MENKKELENKVLILRAALRGRMGEKEGDHYFSTVVHNCTQELEFMGVNDEVELLKKVIFNLERKNDHLFELEKKQAGK